MKKKVKIIFILSAYLIVLTSCASLDNIIQEGGNKIETFRSEQLNELITTEGDLIQEMSEEIIRCFFEKDKEAFKLLFCEEQRSNSSFDKEVDELFNYFHFDIYTTSDIKRTAGGGSSVEDGRKIEWYVRPDIPYISVLVENDEGEFIREYYSINYDWQIVYEEDTSLEGLHYLQVELLNVDEYSIGSMMFQ